MPSSCRSLMALCAALIALAGGPVAAQERPDWLDQVFPAADSIGRFQGNPEAAPVYSAGGLVGYVLSTGNVVGSVGYGGKPFDVLVGLGLDGVITGTYLRSHDEPILVIGVPEQHLLDHVAAYAGLAIDRPIGKPSEEDGQALPDAISGATVSSTVIGDAIVRSARTVAHARGLLQDAAGGARLDRAQFAPASWVELLADGSLVTLRLTRGEVDTALGSAGGLTASSSSSAQPGDLFIELFAGLATPPRIGQNLLGKQAYSALVAEIGATDNLIFVGGRGLYSFKGTQYRRTGVFERLQVVQGDRTFRLTEEGYRRPKRLAADGAPELRETAVFHLPADSGFDPLQPWRLELSVERETKGGARVAGLFPLDYRLPARYRLDESGAPLPSDAAKSTSDLFAISATPGGEALWRGIWRGRLPTIVALLVMLTVLTGALVFQDALVKNRRFYRSFRLIFLAVTLGWLGWLVGGQLSVINVLTFANALLSEFKWEFFLLDPIIFILWGYVAVALLFWGRGVFCGWLCPFGALQELLNEAARLLRVPQVAVPFAVHERLWPIKYVIFLGLFAVSLHSTNLAVLGAEVEPFKTAIALKFQRHWPFVLYAVALLFAGLFIERFFCRYLCPLGAALAIPARLRMFDWLKRKFQCGRECHICAVNCTVQAIHPDGRINPNECIHCLNCQNLYYSDRICPPLIARRKRREARKELRAAAGAANGG